MSAEDAVFAQEEELVHTAVTILRQVEQVEQVGGGAAGNSDESGI